MPRCISPFVPHPPDSAKTELTGAQRENATSIDGAFRDQGWRLKRCYENALSENRNLEVTVKVRWAISRDGSVADVCSVDDTNGVPPGFLGCLSSDLTLGFRWRYLVLCPTYL
jgi:hypothetical protein